MTDVPSSNMSSSPNSIVNQFITKINEIGIWTSYEVKVSLLRDVPSADWKIGSLHIKLLDFENISSQIQYNHECLKLIREVRHISTLGYFTKRNSYKQTIDL
jgi:hypothetical protein